MERKAYGIGLQWMVFRNEYEIMDWILGRAFCRDVKLMDRKLQ